MSIVLNIYEHSLFICIQTKNILMDAAYAEQEPLWRLSNGFLLLFRRIIKYKVKRNRRPL